MDDHFYQQIIEQTDNAYAYHRLICDQDDQPLDYEYIEMNPAYTRLLGSISSLIIGKKHSEFFKSNTLTDQEKLRKFRDVAIFGQQLDFEYYWSELDRWFKILVFSPKKYYFVTILNDITKQVKDAQDKTTVLSVLSDIIFEIDENYVFLNVFCADDRLLMAPRSEIIGHPLTNILPNDLVNRFKSSAEFAKRTGNRDLINYSVQLPDGNLNWFSATTEYIQAEDGHRFIVTISDINDHKLMEDELTQTMQQLEEFFTVNIDLLCIIDHEGRFIKTNKSWESILGYSDYDLRNASIYDYVHPDDVVLTRSNILQCLNQEPALNFTNRYLTKNDNYRNIEWRAQAKGNTVYTAARDITEAKVIEAELRQSSDRFNKLSEQSKTFAWEVDHTGLYTYVSYVVKAVLGYDPEDLVGKHHFYDLHPLDGREAFKAGAMLMFAQKASFANLVNPGETKEGQLVWFSTNGLPVLNPDGSLKGYQGSDVDITERVLMEKEIEDLNHHIQQSLKDEVAERTSELKVAMAQLMEREKLASLGSLVSGIAHEINTPLGIGVTTASYMDKLNRESRSKLADGTMNREELQLFMENLDESLTILNSNLVRASDLIKSFKRISVTQSNEMRAKFKLADYIQAVLISLKHEYKGKDYTFSVDCPEDLSLYSYPGAVSQIYTNLIMNTLIHGFKGKRQGSVNMSAEKNETTVHLTYIDDGWGIPAENISRIFDPFFTTNREHGGSGLGLNIIYNLVTNQLKGTIQCTSAPHKGTRFDIEIPIERMDEKDEQ